MTELLEDFVHRHLWPVTDMDKHLARVPRAFTTWWLYRWRCSAAVPVPDELVTDAARSP